MAMTLEDYISKYGVESGTKRYNGMQKTLYNRNITYSKHPYKRLTKEWFIWRYPDDGLNRFNNHINKSIQSLENFIKRYGEDEGLRKYNQTLKKKDTVSSIREKYGQPVVNERYKKQQQTMRSKTEEERTAIFLKRKQSYQNNPLNAKGKKRIDMFIRKYGEEEGIQKYHQHMLKIFNAPCRMSNMALNVYEEIVNRLTSDQIGRLYCDVEGKQEFWLQDNMKFYSYDITDRQTKTILEYNGVFWHPRIPSEEIHPITKLTLQQMYDKDIDKIKLAEKHGFKVYILYSDASLTEKQTIINNFIERISKVD